jgi:hypothetical protein
MRGGGKNAHARSKQRSAGDQAAREEQRAREDLVRPQTRRVAEDPPRRGLGTEGAKAAPHADSTAT